MSATVRKLLDQIEQLPENERAELLSELGLGREDSPEAVEKAWEDEIVQRLKTLKDGTAVLHDWEDVERELDADNEHQTVRRTSGTLTRIF